MTDFDFKEKDFEKAAEKLASWDLPGAVAELAGVVGSLTGGPLAGALAKGTANSILRGVAKNATLRLLEEGKRIDDEREQRRLLAGYLRESLSGCFADEFKTIIEKLDTITSEQRENHLRELKFYDAAIGELRDLILRELAPSGPSDAELIAAFRQQQVREHGRLVLSGLFPGESPLDLDQVFVEMEVRDCDFDPRVELRKQVLAGGRITLKQLMQRNAIAERAPRWVVLGDPGAGKSTLARHLAWELARSEAETNAPLALYAALPRLAPLELDPFGLAERDLAQGGSRCANGLADTLRSLARVQGRVWLLLDGLDEVSHDHREQIQARLIDWAHENPQVAIAVFSRRVGYEPIGSPYEGFAAVQPLDHPTQVQLLCGWGLERERAETLLKGLSLGLKEACQLPLMATLLAYIVTHCAQGENKEIPKSRRQLLEQSIKILLRCGHRRRGAGIPEPDAAQRILAAVSLRLHELPEEGYWSPAQLANTLSDLLSEPRSGIKKHWREIWLGPESFLQLVSDRTGIVCPRDSAREAWQFLHRQFHELLAAQALQELTQGRASALHDFVKARVRQNGNSDLSRWAEVLGYACELNQEPLKVLAELARLDGQLALRILPELEGVDPVAAFEALGNAEWDGDFLRKLVARWIEGGKHQEDIVEWLWRQVTPERSLLQLSYFHYVLEGLLGGVERERFFTLCNKELPKQAPQLVDIPAGEFWMGSPEDEPERWKIEVRHCARVSTFQLCPTAVTNAEYEEFGPSHERELFGGRLKQAEAANHPVVNVSWWEARLYCAWMDGRLPTDAEWEYACRAGTETPFSFGKNITPAQVNYNGEYPYAGGAKGENRKETVAVGTLPGNPWGLYEMHGNVWEWCEDWFGFYSKEKAVDPKGPSEGERRVLRGGSWNGDAEYSRSAGRFRLEPGLRDTCYGFRLVRGRKTASNQESGATGRHGGGEGPSALGVPTRPRRSGAVS